MHTNHSFEGKPDPLGTEKALAQWLQHILAPSTRLPRSASLPIGEEVSLPGDDYHSTYYPQIPDFAMALLQHDPAATTRYAPLFFHLISCPTCHQAYLEIYDALRAALNPGETQAITQNFPQLKASNIPVPQQIFFCQLLIGEARVLLHQDHRDHLDRRDWARGLLQEAIRFSSHIMQSTMRQRALRDLVAVATLYNDEQDISPSPPALHTYAPLVGSGPGTRGKTLRRAEMQQRSTGKPMISLQSGALEGFITQTGEVLEIHLENLDQSLRGQHIRISVPLGSLLEPVRWVGGDPRAIRSATPVDEAGNLVTVLGSTELLLSNPEERNLLETLFKKLEVRAEV